MVPVLHEVSAAHVQKAFSPSTSIYPLPEPVSLLSTGGHLQIGPSLPVQTLLPSANELDTGGMLREG